MTSPLLKRLYKTLPWLHFSGACLVFVLIYLFTAIHSQLGHEISAGESPGFAWLGQHIFIFMGLAVGFLIAVGGLQHDWMRSNYNHTAAALKIAVFIQFLAVGLLALAVFNGWSHIISAIGFLLLASILMQGYAVLWYQKLKNGEDTNRLRQRESHVLLFLVLLFGFCRYNRTVVWYRYAGNNGTIRFFPGEIGTKNRLQRAFFFSAVFSAFRILYRHHPIGPGICD
jgi:hypothetical protein